MARCLILTLCLLWTAPAFAQNDWGVEWKGSTGSTDDEPEAAEAEPAPEPADAPASDEPATEQARADTEQAAQEQPSTAADAAAEWGPMQGDEGERQGAAEASEGGAPEAPAPKANVDLSRPHRVMIAGAILVGASILVGAALGITADEVELGSLILGGGISAGLVTLGAGAIVRRRRLLDAGYGEDDERAARPLPRGPEFRLTLRY